GGAAGRWGGGWPGGRGGGAGLSRLSAPPPLEEDVEILGFPLVMLNGAADAEPLHWFGRLCDVAPDGTVTLVTGGGRASRADPQRDGGSLSGGPAVGGSLSGGLASGGPAIGGPACSPPAPPLPPPPAS